MEEFLQNLQLAELDWVLILKTAAMLAAVSLVLSAIGHFVFGKRSGFNHAVSSAIGILFVYALTIVLSCLGGEFEKFIAPLPFISINGETLNIFTFAGAAFTDICYHILGMIILAFLANLIDSILPRGENFFSWLLLRCLTVVLAMALHLAATWAFTTYLPDALITYAPTILLVLLVVLLLVGALRFLVGAVLVTVNPLIAAFYTFFFASFVGKQLTKAVLTTAILSGLVYGLNYLGITAISIAGAALVAYIPLVIVLLILWFVVNRLL